LVDTEGMETGEPIALGAGLAMGLYCVIFNHAAARNSIDVHRRLGYTGTLAQSRFIYAFVGMVVAICCTGRLIYLSVS
jgi:hypothetical protein